MYGHMNIYICASKIMLIDVVLDRAQLVGKRIF